MGYLRVFLAFGAAASSLETCQMCDVNSLLQVRAQRASAAMGLGAISYWPPSSGYYASLPNGSLAVVNPSSGVFVEQSLETLAPNIEEFRVVAAEAAARDVQMLGYVPTGYFDHGCNINGECQTLERIGKQIEKYVELFPGLAGIFFDEVAPRSWSCSAFDDEYAALRRLVTDHSASFKIAWNAAATSNCPVDAASAGEIVVLYEASGDQYGTDDIAMSLYSTADYARANGVQTWHLIHTTGADQWAAKVAKARSYQVDWFYSTDVGGDWQAGDNTWGGPPAYWDQFKQEIVAPTIPPAEIPRAPTATVVPSAVRVGGSATLTLNRPADQCCSATDWVGIYARGSSDRLGFVHSLNGEEGSVTLALHEVIADLGEGEYDFKYSTVVDGWVVHDLLPATLEILSGSAPAAAPVTLPCASGLAAAVVPSNIEVGGSATLVLNRPAAQCCNAWDWVGIYAMGSVDRIGFVQSGSTDQISSLDLSDLVTGLDVGEYKFKYSTSVDGWVVHDLSAATLEVVSGPLATVSGPTAIVDVPCAIAVGGSAALTLSRPAELCCSAWDWVGIYEKGSFDRLGFLNSGTEDPVVTFALDTLIANLGEGEYEFKYSTSVDGWVLHDLSQAALAIARRL